MHEKNHTPTVSLIVWDEQLNIHGNARVSTLRSGTLRGTKCASEASSPPSGMHMCGHISVHEASVKGVFSCPLMGSIYATSVKKTKTSSKAITHSKHTLD